MVRLCLFARQSAGPALGALASCRRLWRLAGDPARHDQPSDPFGRACAQGRGMSQPFRIATGGLIDRSRHLAFRFDGREYEGHPGDTLASALLASGVRLVGRSFKYHRPRGILTAGSEEPNALVDLGAGALHEPNSRATTA